MFQWDNEASQRASEESSQFEALPDGTYKVVINRITDKTTKAGTGKYLSFEFEVVEGRHSGRKVWENVNYKNPNPKAEAIAWRSLNEISKAVFGETKQASLTDFEDKHLLIVTKQDGDQTRVKKYLSKNAPKASAAVATPTEDSDVPF